MRSGILTSEFLGKAIVQLFAFVLILVDAFDGVDVSDNVIGLCVLTLFGTEAAYSISRGMAKQGAGRISLPTTTAPPPDKQ